MYTRNLRATRTTQGLTPNQMREGIHTSPGAVEGLVPMGASLPTKQDRLYALSAAPRFDLSSRLIDAHRHHESVVGIEYKDRRYTVRCTRVTGGIKEDLTRAFQGKKANQTVIGVEQDGKSYRMEITPLGETVGGRGKTRKAKGPKGVPYSAFLRKNNK